MPWQKQTVTSGLEMAMTSPALGEVGKPMSVALTAVAPSGMPLEIIQSLPAGVQVDTPSLDELVTAGTITKYDCADGKLTLSIPALEPGQTFAATYKVVPTLAGTLRSAASEIRAGSTRFFVQPSTWTIR